MRDGWPYNIYHVLTMSQMNALVQRRPKKFCSTPMCLWQDVTPFCGLATIFVPDITWVRIFISQATFLCFSAVGWWVSWLEWSGSSRQKESLQHVGDFRDWNQLVMCCKISMYAYSWICTLFIIFFFFGSAVTPVLYDHFLILVCQILQNPCPLGSASVLLASNGLPCRCLFLHLEYRVRDRCNTCNIIIWASHITWYISWLPRIEQVRFLLPLSRMLSLRHGCIMIADA